jgi:hypothetical protein
LSLILFDVFSLEDEQRYLDTLKKFCESKWWIEWIKLK